MEISDTIRFLKSNYPAITEDDIRHLMAISKQVETDRGQRLIRAGECNKTLILVLKGIVRAYYIKENGQEMTPFFWSENLITASWESIFLNRASNLNFEVVEPGALILVDFVGFKKLLDGSDTLRRAYLEMMETILTNTLIHVQTVQNEKPEERYLHFMEDSPELFSRISQKHMASFLGITPISFSRMKKRIGG